MPSPKTLSKTETREKLLANITTAVDSYATAESSALWKIVEECHAAVQTIDTATIRRTLDESFQKSLPSYNDASAKVTLSMICKIAFHATADHFDRWRKDGTGFRKAYKEFATPQKNPAKREVPPRTQESTNTSRVEADGSITMLDPATGKALDDLTDEEFQAYEKHEAERIDVDRETREVNKDIKKGKNSKNPPPPSEAGDPTAAWATRIDRDRRLWTKLLGNLMPQERGAGALKFDMVYETIDVFIGASERKADEFIQTLLQKNELLGKRAKTFIEDNAQLFV